MKKLLLILAVMISAVVTAKAQANNMEIIFNFDKCEYQGDNSFHKVNEQEFYSSKPEGFDKYWEKRKKELCGVFQNAANQSTKGKYLFGQYINSPYYVVIEVEEIDKDGEMECTAKIYRRNNDGGYNPTINQFDIDANGYKSDSYDNISSRGFELAGKKFAKMILKSRLN